MVYGLYSVRKHTLLSWNFINEQGDYLWKGNKWFDAVYYFTDGFARVEIKGKGWNYINTNGELVYKGDKWFDSSSRRFCEGFAKVYKKDRGWNYINTNGELVWKGDIWFDKVDYFSNGIAEVKIEGKRV